MSLVGAHYCSVSGGFEMLFFAGAALAQADLTAGSIATNSVETSSIDMSAVDRVDECIVAQVCIDRYLWALYARTRKNDTIRVPEHIMETVKRKGKTKVGTKKITKPVNE